MTIERTKIAGIRFHSEYQRGMRGPRNRDMLLSNIQQDGNGGSRTLEAPDSKHLQAYGFTIYNSLNIIIAQIDTELDREEVLREESDQKFDTTLEVFDALPFEYLISSDLVAEESGGKNLRGSAEREFDRVLIFEHTLGNFILRLTSEQFRAE